MRDTILELVQNAELGVWNSYECNFCEKQGRPILSIKKTSNKVIARCHSTNCRAHEYQTFYLDGGVNSEAVKKMLLKKEVHKNRSRIYQLPENFTFEIPQKFKDYLLEYHIGHNLIDKYGMGHVQYEYYDNVILKDRLVIPTDDGFVCRSQEDKDRKWINKSSLFSSIMETGCMDTVVVVEDPISCIRVGEILPCICALGTSLSYKQFNNIIAYKNAILWMDYDKGGMDGAIKFRNKLSPYVKCRMVFTEDDPKCLDEYSIRRQLNECI